MIIRIKIIYRGFKRASEMQSKGMEGGEGGSPLNESHAQPTKNSEATTRSALSQPRLVGLERD